MKLHVHYLFAAVLTLSALTGLAYAQEACLSAASFDNTAPEVQEILDRSTVTQLTDGEMTITEDGARQSTALLLANGDDGVHRLAYINCTGTCFQDGQNECDTTGCTIIQEPGTYGCTAVSCVGAGCTSGSCTKDIAFLDGLNGLDMNQP